MIVLESHMNELLFEMFDNLLTIYYDKFVGICGSLTIDSFRRVNETLKSDYKILQTFCEHHLFKGSKRIVQKFRLLKTFFETEDIDECITSLLNITIYCPKLKNSESIIRVLKAKIHFPLSSIQLATSFLEKSIKIDSYQQKIHKQAFYSVFMNATLHRLIIKFSKFIRRFCQKRKIGNQKNKNNRSTCFKTQTRLQTK